MHHDLKNVTAPDAALDWVRDAVFYHIFPERYDNADPSCDPPGTQPWGGMPTRDNFFGGDLDGVARRLDHLSALGVNALYLTPVFDARTNHRYDTVDYLSIDPHLGGEAAFDRFITASHAVGVKVVLDAVFHHCGVDHPHFADVIRNGAASPFVNWFYVAGFPVDTSDPNYLTCSGCWYLPKLNVYNPAVRDHLYWVASHWLERGIDGWRLDVPYMMENPHFWRGFRDVVKGHGADKWICAEVWEQATEWAISDTSDGAMNYRLRDAILSFVSEWRGGGEAFAHTLSDIDDEIPASHKGLMLNLLGSHDTERVLSHCGGDKAAARLAYGLLFAAEGAPMIYYGDEIGLEGFNDPDCRRCMPWDQTSWDLDMLDWLRTLARVRKASIALRRGDETTVSTSENTIVRRRTHPDQTVIIAANRAPTPQAVALGGMIVGTELLTGAHVAGTTLTLGPKEIAFVNIETQRG